jgi:hypothetical protein
MRNVNIYCTQIIVSPLWFQWVVGSILGSGTSCELSCLLVLSLATRVFLWVLWFSSLLKNQHFQIPIRSGVSPISWEAKIRRHVNKVVYLLFYLFLLTILTFKALSSRRVQCKRMLWKQTCDLIGWLCRYCDNWQSTLHTPPLRTFLDSGLWLRWMIA